MDGVHDMGGMHGFGPIERDELSYHDEWEARVHAVSTAMAAPGGGRFSLEALDPAEYLGSSYYKRWLLARIHTLLAAGIITADEFSAAVARYATDPAAALPADDHEAYAKASAKPGPSDTSAPVPPASVSPYRFKVGDQVVARTIHPEGHTRLPRYVRGRKGEVIHSYRRQGFQDHESMSDHVGDQPVYAVRFAGTELWGDQAQANSSVVLDMWEAYLDDGR